ncbi:hypothetical protein OQJ19_00520 [Fluoribacter gormanii]|uniref:Uncharacterized protein n=1 Tax=Fluoribacter gormanii TaxID=464 RepID=A0A377GI88_9GAMM|nr:hypothetical protein [Fluoribacter gormanii]KTD03453.1 hypothetical protein Lgor_1438 [Fluoribacter gormanii]MCW8443960.1 hypothetical protein [Fluoribacter gormanii]MCW8469142.1 hypothetical protein [Fluoribacter gormanii]SIQ48091.1 hypothetical protein SAMN05421777_101126 [Fluoribacter gormanii]STO24481.1 Uncharacterised protein [Fluoribacter gormanii]
MEFSKINPLALGISISVLSALASFFMGLAAFVFYTGKPFVAMVGSIYLSYTPSLANAGLGAAIVLMNTFVSSYIAAWVYNFLLDYIR